VSERYAPTLSGTARTDLPEFEAPPSDPFEVARRWVEAAEREEVREPRAMTLATADAAGRTSSRVVMLKRLDADGAVFTTSYASRKAHDLAENPYAAGTLYWRETLQQLSFAGSVRRLPDDEADALFAERPRPAQAVAAHSRPDAPLDREDAIRDRVQALAAGSEPIPRPQAWGGFRIEPETFEFWCGSPDRLHRRLQYVREEGRWRASRLQP
jgi:dihydrophenazinedicarboxylate synthase